MCDVAGQRDFDLVGRAAAAQFAALEVCVALLHAIIDRWVD